MNKVWLGMAGAAMALFAAGCYPELAQVNPGADEEEWKEFASNGYSGYRPPRMSSRAEKDKYQDKVNFNGAAADPVEAAEDPAEISVEVVETETAEETPVVSAEEKKGSDELLQTEEADETETAPVKEEKVDEKPAETVAGTAVEGEEYTVKPGDTLSGIAKRFYKDGNLSDIIFKANPGVLKTPHALRPGMKLIIPKM